MPETQVKHSARYRNIGVQDVILSMNQDYDSAVCVVGSCRIVDTMVCGNIFIYYIGKVILIFVMYFQERRDRKIRLREPQFLVRGTRGGPKAVAIPHYDFHSGHFIEVEEK